MSALSLKVENLYAGYGQTQIIENISFALIAGERLSILGRNGVGKSTLLATIAGLTNQYSGHIAIDNKDVSKIVVAHRAYMGLGYVPQKRDIFKSLTVEENLIMGLKKRKLSALEEAYTMFPRLKERRKNLGLQLSGGEQQMLTTARTLLGQPKILLLDEPLEGLAPIICEELMQVFTQLATKQSMTIILVEQRIQPALDFAEKVIILERGQIAYAGTAEDLSQKPEVIDKTLGVAHLH